MNRENGDVTMIKKELIVCCGIALLVYSSTNALNFSITNQSIQPITNARVYPEGNCDFIEISDDHRPLPPQKSFVKASACAELFQPRVTLLWTETQTTNFSLTAAASSIEVQVVDTIDLKDRIVEIIYIDKLGETKKERFTSTGTRITP